MDHKDDRPQPHEATPEPGLSYEKPNLDLRLLEDAAKAFAVKSGMGSC